MKRAASQPMLRHFQEVDDDDDDDDEVGEEEEEEEFRIKGKSLSAKQAACMTVHKKEAKKPYEELFSCEKYGAWRQEQRITAAKLKKQLKSRWAIHKLIDEHLARFRAHYTRSAAPTKMCHVAHHLKPKWAPPHEIAALYWLGDWRPSTVLHLLHSLSHSLWDPVGVDRSLCQLINDIRIEEAVIDEEMAEIQSNCVLHLPFGRTKSGLSGSPLSHVRSEFKKIHRVIVKAQNLRMKALEVAIKKVLSQTDAAEFLVAFVGIQDFIHEFSVKCKTRKGPVCIKEIGG